ncbi:MAG: sugar ABC transporter ATP-binding protein [Blautia sp.]|nr:sugar ABC transporter ATP-binding protein [Blautia sp.]
MENSMNYILEFKNITKEFPGVKALDQVSMRFAKGEVVALLGENGAGKSTLMKVLSGAYTRDSGDVILDGKALPKQYSTLDARDFGIAIIYQELSLLSELTVMENVYISHEPRKIGTLIDFKKMYDDTKTQLAKLEADQIINPKGKVGPLPLPQKQMVEIAKALALDCKVLVMDEPTTSLTNEEAEHLFGIIRTLQKAGITIIYISHRMNEIFEICDRAIVMRDGKVAGECIIADSTPDDIIQLMSGSVLQEDLVGTRTRRDKENSTPVLELEHVTDGGFIEDMNLTVYEGEVLGIGGLVGAKRTELMRMVCGVDPLVGGNVKIHGKPVHITNTSQAIENGIGYLSENRKEDGLSLGLSIEENTIQCDMSAAASKGFINWRKVHRISDGYIQKLKTKGTSSTKVVNLSGGNQQKVAIAKWLHAGCDLLVFDEPTRGIDVMAKAEIHRLIRNFASEKGKAAVVISSEANELVAVSDRVIIMNKGHITGELEAEELDQNHVMQYITNTKGR